MAAGRSVSRWYGPSDGTCLVRIVRNLAWVELGVYDGPLDGGLANANVILDVVEEKLQEWFHRFKLLLSSAFFTLFV